MNTPITVCPNFARKLERELAALSAERDQLRALLVYADQILDDIDTCSDAHKPMYSSYSQNVFKLCIKGRDSRRAAIADSEARACDQLRAEVKLLSEWQQGVIENARAHHAERKDANARAERAEAELADHKTALEIANRSADEQMRYKREAEAELATERARLDAVVANCWAVHSEGGSSFSVFSNVCGDYIATAQTYRAAIDAAMKEETK